MILPPGKPHKVEQRWGCTHVTEGLTCTHVEIPLSKAARVSGVKGCYKQTENLQLWEERCRQPQGHAQRELRERFKDQERSLASTGVTVSSYGFQKALILGYRYQEGTV